MISYDTEAYRLSKLPENFCIEKFPALNGIVTVHSIPMLHPSLFNIIKTKLGFVKRRYRVTLWLEDKIASFTDVDVWKKDYEFQRNVILRLFKAIEKEV